MVPSQYWYVIEVTFTKNLGFPSVVMVEYSSIMRNILDYLNTKQGSSDN